MCHPHPCHASSTSLSYAIHIIVTDTNNITENISSMVPGGKPARPIHPTPYEEHAPRMKGLSRATRRSVVVRPPIKVHQTVYFGILLVSAWQELVPFLTSFMVRVSDTAFGSICASCEVTDVLGTGSELGDMPRNSPTAISPTA